MDSVLITEPVTSLDSVVCVPAPVIAVHVAEGCVNSTLSGYSVRTSREQLGNACSFESLLN